MLFVDAQFGTDVVDVLRFGFAGDFDVGFCHGFGLSILSDSCKACSVAQIAAGLNAGVLGPLGGGHLAATGRSYPL